MKMTTVPIAIAIVFQLATAGIASAADTSGFDQLDTNRDGVLSKSEAAKVPSVDFAKADTNKDGSLSRSEYEAAIG